MSWANFSGAFRKAVVARSLFSRDQMGRAAVFGDRRLEPRTRRALPGPDVAVEGQVELLGTAGRQIGARSPKAERAAPHRPPQAYRAGRVDPYDGVGAGQAKGRGAGEVAVRHPLLAGGAASTAARNGSGSLSLHPGFQNRRSRWTTGRPRRAQRPRQRRLAAPRTADDGDALHGGAMDLVAGCSRPRRRPWSRAVPEGLSWS